MLSEGAGAIAIPVFAGQAFKIEEMGATHQPLDPFVNGIVGGSRFASGFILEFLAEEAAKFLTRLVISLGNGV